MQSLLLILYDDGIDQPVALVTDYNNDGEMDVLSIVRDRQNSVKLLVNEKQEIVQEVSYSAYGETQILNRGQSNPKLNNIFYYTSRELEPELGVYYYRARYYDPGTGRFLSEDPIGLESGDPNRYRYVRNNPISFRDPSGLILVYACGDAEKAFKDDIEKIRSTPDGEALLALLENSKFIFKIYKNNMGMNFTRGTEVHVDPSSKPFMTTTIGPQQASTTRVLAHELGHLTGAKDDDNNTNVIRYENPIMFPIEGFKRIGY